MTRDAGRPSSGQDAKVAKLFVDALAFHQRGRLGEAEMLYRQVLASEPWHFGSLHLLGVISSQRGDHAAALERIDAALRLNSGDADAWNNRAIALRELKRLEEALAACDRAIALNPAHARAFTNRGSVLVDLNRPQEALASFDRAIALNPHLADAFNNRGKALMLLERLPEALESYNRAVVLAPDNREMFCSRGYALKELNRLGEALASYDRAIALEPAHFAAHADRGILLMELNRLKEAIGSLDRAIGLKPDCAEALNNRGLAKLLAGDYRGGWADHEWRWKAKTFAAERPQSGAPEWQGEEIEGKRILVFGEQGLGDVIQFVRYLPLLVRKGARVTLLVKPNLLRLLSTLEGPIEIVATLGKADRFDFQCPLMGLPKRFGTEVETIPASVPYLKAEEDRVARWKQHIGDPGFKIGIAWRTKIGSTLGVRLHGERRSLRVAELAPLGRIAGVRLISLQKQHGLEQLSDLPSDVRVETLGPDFDDGPDAFLDTAAVMRHLDLVVTVDTSIAHLAGALAMRTWIALKLVPDWRWLLGRCDSPWYPTLRLYRQDRDGDWTSVVAKMEQDLAALIVKR
jgi:tetratricopeptide (TPR) repeat protein